METPISIVQQIYAAFGSGDVAAILALLADRVDWEFVGSPGLAYAGARRNREEVGAFFAAIGGADQIHAFEPREFIQGGQHVTVLGWEQTTALDTRKDFSTEWVHVFTVTDGKVTRWRGFYNTAARHGL